MLSRDKGDFINAEQYIRKALAIQQQTMGSNHPAVSESLHMLAETLWMADKKADSQLVFESLWYLISQNINLFLNYGSESRKLAYIETLTEISDSTISFDLQNDFVESASDEIALNSILQRKGKVLEILSANQQNLYQGLNSEGLALLEELNETRTKLAELILSRPLSPSEEEYQSQVLVLTEDLEKLEDELSRQSLKSYQGSQSVSAKQIQTLLPTETALLEFVLYRPVNLAEPYSRRFGSPRYAVYILFSNGQVEGIDLGDASEIDEAINKMRTGITSPNTPLFQVQESARFLYSLIMSPIKGALGNVDTVFISPEGSLNLIPFETLVNENNHYLIEDYQFRYLSTGRDLLRLSEEGSKAPAILMGNPTYGRSDETLDIIAQDSTRTFDLSQRIFPALVNTQSEVEWIAEVLPDAQTYTGTAATEAFVKQLQPPSILHIATHGFFERNTTEESPNPLLQSGLILAGAKHGQSGVSEDGILTSLELSGLNLNGTQLAVLSACDTGLGELAIGEGLYGLRRALVLAGTQSQVISLWKVDDNATQELMVDYYDRLLAGIARDTALRETQLAFLNHDDYSHPYYWAAFIGSGDWRPLSF